MLQIPRMLFSLEPNPYCEYKFVQISNSHGLFLMIDLHPKEALRYDTFSKMLGSVEKWH